MKDLLSSKIVKIGCQFSTVCRSSPNNETSVGRISGSCEIPVCANRAVVECSFVLCSPCICQSVGICCGNFSFRSVTICVCVICTISRIAVIKVIRILHQITNLLPTADLVTFFSHIGVLQLDVGCD